MEEASRAQDLARDLRTLSRLTSAAGDSERENNELGSPQHMLLGADVDDIRLGYEHRVDAGRLNTAAQHQNVVMRCLEEIPFGDLTFFCATLICVFNTWRVLYSYVACGR